MTASVGGKVCVVTGASRGLGAGLAREFAARGMRLGLCARGEPALADGDEVVAARASVTDRAAVDAFTRRVEERLGRIDLWINNAGLLEPIGPLRGADAAAWARNIDVNVMGVFHGTQAYLAHLERTGGASAGAAAGGPAGGGILVNISSGAGRKGYFGWSAYCAGKAAVDRMSECLALEEKSRGLRVHAVAPGIIETEMQEQIRAATAEQFPERDRFVKIHRDGTASSVAWVAAHLLELCFDPAHRTDDVLVGLPLEHPL